MKKISVIACVLLMPFLVSCSTIESSFRKQALSDVNFHIDEVVEYKDSPFGPFVKKAFKENKNFAHILEIGDTALLERIHLVRLAQKAIYVQTYIWEDDESGRFMMYELFKAAERGVKVKILVDHVAQDLNPAMVAFLSTAGPNLEIKFYNPNAKKIDPHRLNLLKGVLDIKKINQRMHNKIVVIDDRIGITGGRNYQDDYYDRGKARNFKDRDVLVAGPVVRDMTDSFKRYWEFYLSFDARDMVDVGCIIKKNELKRYETKERYSLGNTFYDLDQCASDYACMKNALSGQVFKVDKIKFIVDQPGKNKDIGLGGSGETSAELAELVLKARKKLIIQTPYLVLNGTMRRFFKKIRRHNPDLDIIISSNSLSAADHYYAYAFAYKHKRYYVRDLKWRIFEFKKYPKDLDIMVPRIDGVERAGDYFTCIHSKSLIVDDEISYIGSFNLDPRSVNLNTEAGFIIYDYELSQALKKYILLDINPKNSWTVGKSKHVPLKSHFSGLMMTISKLIPVFDFWPFGYAESFELKEGGRELPFYHEDFYDNYTSVGPFPEAPFTEKEIKTRFTKVFFGPFEPMI